MNTALADFFAKYTSKEKPPVLLACSGGIDSMVLAHMLLDFGMKPGIAHCNFKLRQEADADEKWLHNWCENHQLTFHSTSFDTAGYAAGHKISTQMAARELRYAYFDKLLEQEPYDFLLTAHHADDSLETILINLGRKPELLSMAGIKPSNNRILRPLWLMSRKEIAEYAEKHAVQWREDASNADVHYQRNKLRHEVIPQFKTALPHLSENWSATLDQLNEERLLLEHLIHDKLEKLLVATEKKQELHLSQVREQPGIKSLLHHWLKPYGNFDIEAIAGVLHQFSGKEFTSESHRLLLHRGRLVLEPREDKSHPQEYLITESDRYLQQPMEMVIEKLPRKNFNMDPATQAAALDYTKLTFPLKIRRWKAGDRFVPLGMNGKKKLSDFFIDNNFSRSEKENTWLLCSGKDIVWVMGHRIDDRYKLTNQTKTVYFVRILN